jgi:hypothetical protein
MEEYLLCHIFSGLYLLSLMGVATLLNLHRAADFANRLSADTLWHHRLEFC